MLAKDDGGTRPLTRTAVAWRLGASVFAKKLSGWTAKWATGDILGGLHERGVHDVFGRLACARSSVRGRGGHLALITQDLTKAFDSVSPRQAVAILRRLGLPIGICEVVKYMYNHTRRIVSMSGTYAADWVRPRRGLMQGCPLSPLLLGELCWCGPDLFFGGHQYI